MKRIALIVIAIVLVVVAVLLVRSCRDDSGKYLVRAAFDNGGFVTPNVDVRVAGANVGSVHSIDVSMPEEDVSSEPENQIQPGKAIVVMNIKDDAFKDFREDASCIIRPQSLIGEKFIDCQVTQPRQPGTEPPPELEVIPDGQPGAGQRLLPLENNGHSVDQDLINNIYRLPYAQRFRVVLNELGAGLASRGPDLNETITRANPTLMQVNKVLAILASHNKKLAQLARDGDNNLTPLAEKRRNMVGFFRSASTVAAAQAERGEDMRANLRNLAPTLRDLRKTMGSIEGFADASLPVFQSLEPNAERISALNTKLGPFADATRVSLTSLGRATRTAGPDLVASTPIIKRLGTVARKSRANAENLHFFLESFRESDGYSNLMRLFHGLGSALNGYDSQGHYQRTFIVISGCSDYSTLIDGSTAGACSGRWDARRGNDVSASIAMAQALPDLDSGGGIGPDGLGVTGTTGTTGATGSGASGETGPTGETSTGATSDSDGSEPADSQDSANDSDAVTDQADSSSSDVGSRMRILDYLLGN